MGAQAVRQNLREGKSVWHGTIDEAADFLEKSSCNDWSQYKPRSQIDSRFLRLIHARFGRQATPTTGATPTTDGNEVKSAELPKLPTSAALS